MNIFLPCFALGLAFGVMTGTIAATIDVLSAGAVEPGLRAAVKEFEAATGHKVVITFNSAPRLKARLASNQFADIVIAPLDTIEEQENRGRFAITNRAIIGRVGIGMAVRSNLTKPTIGSEAAFEKTLRSAKAVIYNNASTGVHLQKQFDRLGWSSWIQDKAERPGSGSEVAERLLKGQGSELEVGFAAITEMNLYADRGLNYVGPVPGAFQNFTQYAVSLDTQSNEMQAATALLKYLSSPKARVIFIEHGAWTD
jgi:molybdate transport system substrate-binding protein